MKNLVYLAILTMIFLLSCEEKTDWELQSGDMDRLVVDAMLTSENKNQVIRLSLPVADPNQEPVPAAGAFVKVNVDTSVWIFEESAIESGVYYSKDPQGASIDKTYQLEIQYKGKTYTAQTYMVPLVQSWPVEVTASGNNDGLYKVHWTDGGYNPADLAMYEVVIDWSHLVNDPDSLSKARLIHYTLNTIDVSYVLFPQDREDVFFPAGSIISIRKYSLTPEHDAYLRALLAETEWQGSLFEDARGNLPTNISHGGLGYFSACAVVEETVVVGK